MLMIGGGARNFAASQVCVAVTECPFRPHAGGARAAPRMSHAADACACEADHGGDSLLAKSLIPDRKIGRTSRLVL
jgi:hypothetical protein